MNRLFQKIQLPILFALISLIGCSKGPEDAFDVICDNCVIKNGVALVGACRGDAKLNIDNGILTVSYAVDCGNGSHSAKESGSVSDLKVVHTPEGSYIKGRWVNRGANLSDADLKLSFNDNWEYHYGRQLKLALYSSAWEYQFNWTTSDNTIDELCELIYSDEELATIKKKRQQRIPLDYNSAGEIEILGFILNSKWRNTEGDAKINFDSTSGTLYLNCTTNRGNQTYSLGNLRFEEEFDRMMTYRKLNFYNRGFWVDYLVPYYTGQTLLESKGLILESSGGRFYFDNVGFFNNYGPQENIISEVALRKILTKLKERKVPVRATNNVSSESSDEYEYYTVVDPDGYSNLRESPGGKVIRQVFNGEKFRLISESQNYKKVKFGDASTGYIHTSRIVNFNTKVCDCLSAAKKIVERDVDIDLSDGISKSILEKYLEIFRFNQCPKGCAFLGDESVIDFSQEIQRCKL